MVVVYMRLSRAQSAVTSIIYAAVDPKTTNLIDDTKEGGESEAT